MPIVGWSPVRLLAAGNAPPSDGAAGDPGAAEGLAVGDPGAVEPGPPVLPLDADVAGVAVVAAVGAADVPRAGAADDEPGAGQRGADEPLVAVGVPVAPPDPTAAVGAAGVDPPHAPRPSALASRAIMGRADGRDIGQDSMA